MFFLMLSIPIFLVKTKEFEEIRGVIFLEQNGKFFGVGMVGVGSVIANKHSDVTS